MDAVRRTRASALVLSVVALAAVIVALPAVAMAAGTITGTVRDAGDNVLSGIKVQTVDTATGLVGDVLETGPTGAYTITVPNGSYVVVFRSDPAATVRYASLLAGVTERKPEGLVYPSDISDPIVVADDVRTVDVTMQVGATLNVRVRRPVPSSLAVPGVRVWLYTADPAAAGHLEGTTNSDGMVAFDNVYPGQWRAVVSDPVPSPYTRYATANLPSQDPLPAYLTIAPGDLTALWDVTMSKFPSVTLDVAGGTVWQRALTGVIVTLTRVPNDDPDPYLYFRIEPGTPDAIIGRVDSMSRTVSGEGEHILVGYARLGTNQAIAGPETTAAVRIDNSAPVSWSNADGKSHLFDIGASDALSGVAHRWYTMDGGAPTELTGPVSLPLGMHNMTWWAEDAAGNVEAAHSGLAASGPQPTMRRPVAPTPVRRGRYFRVYGYLSRVKNHTTATLLAYKWDGSQWVYKRSKKVTIHTPSSGLSRYSVYWYLPSTGSWKIVARFNGGGGKIVAFSPGKSIRVR